MIKIKIENLDLYYSNFHALKKYKFKYKGK